MEESFKRLMEAVTSRDSGSSAVARGDRRTESNQYPMQGHPAELENPFATRGTGYGAVVPRGSKLEFPHFHGGYSTEWLSKVKQYFEYHKMPHTQLVRFIAFHLDGVAYGWWRTTQKALRNDNIAVTWEVFEPELWARFGPNEGENFHEALMQIRQTGSLEAYQEEFERLHNKVFGLSQEALVGAFMNGLHYSIANRIRMFQPKSLQEVINYARLMERQLQR